MIRAIPDDRAEIEAFLGARAVFAMFPLTNLHRHGMAGGHPRAMRFWLARASGAAEGAVSDILSISEEGMVMPCLPSADFAAAARVLAGQSVIGIIGPKADVRGLQRATGLQGAPTTLDRDEPHFTLSLSRLVVPAGPGQLYPLAHAPQAVILDWMRDYQIEALNTPESEAVGRAAESYRAYCAAGSHHVLMEGSVPLAMTGFNARLTDLVQIGGVYTPPDLRGRGHARRAVALHLAAAEREGVARAALFSASDMAARAYRAIGFQQIGEWTLLLFHGAQVVHG